MDTDEPVVLSRRGETIALDSTHVDDVHRHSAFSVWDDADQIPAGVDPTSQFRAAGDPVPVRRSDLDDVARAESEALISLAAALDQVCLDLVLAQCQVDEVPGSDLAAWLVEATQSVSDAAEPVCSLDVYLDTGLRRSAGLVRDGRRLTVDAGWCQADVLLMSRHRDTGFAVVAEDHLLGLRGYLAVSLTSVDFGPEEFLSASAVFGYSPRISLHPGWVRVAQVTPPTPRA